MDPYREEILEHWRNPQNFGEMKNADLVIDQVNPLCGDEITFFFKFSRQIHPRGESKVSVGEHPRGVIREISFTANGCAISIASASMLSEEIKGKSVKELEKITGEDILELLGGTVAPARLKCAFLPLEAIRKAQGKLSTL